MPDRPRRPNIGSRSQSSSAAIKEQQRKQAQHNVVAPSQSFSPSRASSFTGGLAPSGGSKTNLNKSHSKLHVVGTRGYGHGHGHTRVSSHGKNLHRLTKDNQRRSGTQLSPTSPLPPRREGSMVGLARNSSNASLLKNNTSAASRASLKKNRSDVVLKRHGSSAAVERSRREGYHGRRSNSHGAQALSRPKMTSVHFALGAGDEDEEEEEEGWTEVSNSPTAHRGSMVDQNVKEVDEPTESTEAKPETRHPEPPREETPQRKAPDKSATHHDTHDRYHPDPQAITARLLHRRPPVTNAPPQMSTTSATATPGSHSPRDSIERSQSHLAVDKASPNRPTSEELLSRFVGSHDGRTSTNGSMRSKPHIDSPMKKRESVVDIRPPSPQPPPSYQTSALAGNPYHDKSSANLSSRTQQKLWLQRAASSVTEVPSSHHNPALNTATGAHPYLGTAPMSSASAQRQRDHAGSEYRVVRRFQNPLYDGFVRLGLGPVVDKKRGSAKNSSLRTAALHENAINATRVRAPITKSQSYKVPQPETQVNAQATKNGPTSSQERPRRRSLEALQPELSTSRTNSLAVSKRSSNLREENSVSRSQGARGSVSHATPPKPESDVERTLRRLWEEPSIDLAGQD